jgi:hypothetical protein
LWKSKWNAFKTKGICKVQIKHRKHFQDNNSKLVVRSKWVIGLQYDLVQLRLQLFKWERCDSLFG